jgi:hypothetical protein
VPPPAPAQFALTDIVAIAGLALSLVGPFLYGFVETWAPGEWPWSVAAGTWYAFGVFFLAGAVGLAAERARLPGPNALSGLVGGTIGSVLLLVALSLIHKHHFFRAAPAARDCIARSVSTVNPVATCADGRREMVTRLGACWQSQVVSLERPPARYMTDEQCWARAREQSWLD